MMSVETRERGLRLSTPLSDLRQFELNRLQWALRQRLHAETDEQISIADHCIPILYRNCERSGAKREADTLMAQFRQIVKHASEPTAE